MVNRDDFGIAVTQIIGIIGAIIFAALFIYGVTTGFKNDALSQRSHNPNVPVNHTEINCDDW